jgi:hypothetical protein
MIPNAPYTGGASPGAQLFFVDGDWSRIEPCGPPIISTPFTGDTILANNDIVLLSSAGQYVLVPLGEGYNLQPAVANQATIVIEQEFMCALAAYVPTPLNSSYNTVWSIGWQGNYSDLGSCVLVEESALEDVGGGMVKFKRTYATIPFTRSEPESYPYQFPGLGYSNGKYRPSFVRPVNSRVQYDFFLYDFDNIATGFAVFPNGPVLNQQTGMNPVGLILPEQRYYGYSADNYVNPDGSIGSESAVANNIFLPSGAQLQNPSDPNDPNTGSIPPTYQYLEWVQGNDSGDNFTSNGLPAEIVAETSVLVKWKGNIYMRKTRFVVAI